MDDGFDIVLDWHIMPSEVAKSLTDTLGMGDDAGSANAAGFKIFCR
jgi:hypothetical protein